MVASKKGGDVPGRCMENLGRTRETRRSAVRKDIERNVPLLPGSRRSARAGRVAPCVLGVPLFALYPPGPQVSGVGLTGKEIRPFEGPKACPEQFASRLLL